MDGSAFLLIFYGILGCLGVTMNGLLLYVSLFRSPAQIRMYRILIVNFAITDMASCFFIMTIVPRIIPIGYTMVNVFYGVCHHIGIFSCYAAYSLTVHLFVHTMWSLLLSFAYRYYILISGPPSTSKIVLCLILVYIPSFTQFIVFMLTAGDPLEIMNILHAKLPFYEIKIETVTGITDVFSPAVSFTIANTTIPIFPMYTAMLILRRKILHKLEENADHLRSETKSIHQQLLKALTLQACLPFLFLCGVIIFFCLVSKLVSGPAFECLIFAIPAPIPLLSCLISFSHIRPYRQALLRLILRTESRFPIVPKDHHSSAVALAPQPKLSMLSVARLHRLSVPHS